MLNAYRKFRQLGFTLIELMIGVVIIAILMSVAVPSFESWMRDTQVRNAAESIQNGLQRSRGEAVARNTNIAFTLGAGADSSWTIAGSGIPAIESRAGSDGSKNVTRTVLPLNTSTVTFNSLGGLATNADNSDPFTQVDLAATGSNRNLRVTIGVGGNVRMCDPNLPPTDSRGC